MNEIYSHFITFSFLVNLAKIFFLNQMCNLDD